MRGLDEWPFIVQGNHLIPQGVDIGPRPEIVVQVDNLMVVYVAGHTRYGGRMSQNMYEPAKYHLFEVLSTEEDGGIVLLPLLSFTAKRNRKRTELKA